MSAIPTLHGGTYRLSFFQSSQNLSGTGYLGEVLEEYFPVIGIERDQAIPAEDLEISVSVKNINCLLYTSDAADD